MSFFFCKIGLWLCGRPVSCARIRKRQEKVSLKPFQRLAERETASRGLLASASAGKIRKNIPVGCFSKKTLAGGFLNAVPDGGRLSPIPPEIPPKRVQRAAGDFNRLCGCPSRPLVPKGGTRFRGQGRLDCRKLTQSLRLCQGTPDEGSLRKAFRRKPFLPTCVCRRRLRPQGRCPRTPTAFEKAGKTFTCLAKTQARAFGLAALIRPRRPQRRSRHVPRGHAPRLECPGTGPDALRITARLILPPMVLGSSSTYSMTRGYL